MTIQTQTPWRFKALYSGLGLLAAGVIALLSYQWGHGSSGFGGAGNPAQAKELLQKLSLQVEQLQKERDKLTSAANAAESKWNIERSAQTQLATQVKALEAEKVKLTEDLAFFESLLPANTGPSGVAIRRLTVNMAAPNQLRYRVLVMQGGKGQQDFNGALQLALTVIQGGKSVMMNFPDAKAGETDKERDKYKLGFKHYQRLEGLLTLPEGTTVKSVQARILERGQVRTQQSANL